MQGWEGMGRGGRGVWGATCREGGKGSGEEGREEGGGRRGEGGRGGEGKEGGEEGGVGMRILGGS